MRAWAAGILVAALAIATGAPASAQEAYPRRPITMIVPFPAGGTSDLIGRLIAKRLGEVFAQSVVVENRPGAGGNLGAQMVARAQPDGHTMMLTAAAVSVMPALHQDPGFELFRNVRPVVIVGEVPFMLVAANNLAVSTPQELWAYIRQNPGKANFGSGGNGTIVHLAAEMLKQQAGLDFVHIPYRGGLPALQDIVAGTIQFSIDGGPHVMNPVNAKTIKLLAVATPQRLPQFPQVPTIAETGLPGFEASAWQGVFVTGGTPEPIVRRLNAEIAKAVRAEEVVKLMGDLGVRVTAAGLEETDAFVKAEVEKWGAVVRKGNIKPE